MNILFNENKRIKINELSVGDIFTYSLPRNNDDSLYFMVTDADSSGNHDMRSAICLNSGRWYPIDANGEGYLLEGEMVVKLV